MEKVKDELDLLASDERQRFLQIVIIILGVCCQVCPYYPKYQVCYFFAIS